MKEDVEKFISQLDAVAERYNVLPRLMDQGVELWRSPSVTFIISIINRVSTRFSPVAVALFAFFYILLCLKNAFLCAMHNAFPYIFASFLFIFLAFVSTVLSTYIIYKLMGSFERIISSSPCRISSYNIFSISVFLYKFVLLLILLFGFAGAWAMKSFTVLVLSVGAAFFCLIMALFNSTPEDFAIVQDEKASAGEDLVSLFTFGIKALLRLVPIVVFILPFIGIVLILPELFSSYLIEKTLDVTTMTGAMGRLLSGFLIVTFIPLLAYIFYLLGFLQLDIIRTILSLPQKLDDLKK